MSVTGKSNTPKEHIAFLQARIEELTAITNGVPGLIAYVDRDHRVIFHNETYGKWFGKSAENLMGKHMREFLGEQDYRVTISHVEDVLRGIPQDYERTLFDVNGNAKHVNAIYRPHKVNGEIVGFFALVRDITKQKEAECALALKKNQQTLAHQLSRSALQDTSLNTIFDNALMGLRELVRCDLCEILGYNPKKQSLTVQNAHGWSKQPPNTHISIPRPLSNWLETPVHVIQHELHHEFPGAYLFKDQGAVCTLSVGLYDIQGAVGLLNVHTRCTYEYTIDDIEFVQNIADTLSEIIQRHQAIRRLHEQKEQALITLQSIGDAVIVTDQYGIITTMNAPASKLTGEEVSAALGQHVSHVFRPDDVTQTVNTQSALPSYDTELSLTHKNGTLTTIENVCSPIIDTSGETLGMVLVFRDITERKQVERRLSHDATHDPLTGLFNRRAFEHHVEKLLHYTNKNSTHAICYIDLDRFKRVNDHCGHAAGDKLLEQLSKTIQSNLRRNDLFARLGGDEFALLLRRCDTQNALHLADTLRETINGFRFEWEGETFDIGASIGVVMIDHPQEDVASILSAADHACYAAKNAGRNCVHLYQRNSRPINNNSLYERIRQAIEKRTLIFYQTRLLDLRKDPTDCHYKIHIRLHDDLQKTLMSPKEFMPAAERYALMPSIDYHTFEYALDWCNSHRESPMLKMHVTLSNDAATNRDFKRRLEHLFGQHNTSKEQIVVELNDQILSNQSNAKEWITFFRSHDMQIAVSNFIHGSLPLQQLPEINPDMLKIRIHHDTKNHYRDTLLKSFGDIAHQLNTQLVVSNHPNDRELEQMAEWGVHLIEDPCTLEEAPPL